MIQTRLLTLTQANVDNGHMYLTECMGIFPKDTLGGANESQAAPRKVQIHFGGSVATTDIDQGKRIFRSRCFRQFFAENSLAAGDRVLLEQRDPYTYRVSAAGELACLSIQQPWADFILDGIKLVENRNRRWKEAEQKLAAGESVSLGIHVSKTVGRELQLKRDELAPGWHPSIQKRYGGFVHGIVEVIKICRYECLPTELKTDPFVDQKFDFHWVLKNPRK
ncbi:MAG: hypothetical protein HY289_06785, partial [Planctomycetes bacterium]|nr:hypothetical protein [Planctomycetota bacterium]